MKGREISFAGSHGSGLGDGVDIHDPTTIEEFDILREFFWWCKCALRMQQSQVSTCTLKYGP